MYLLLHLYSLFFYVKTKCIVGADSLVGSAPTYSGIMLQASRVRILTRGPFPILSPLSLQLLFLSDLSYHNKGINAKNKS